MKKHMMIALCMVAVLACVPALAAMAEDETDGYQAGQAQAAARHAVYSQLENHPDSMDKTGYTDIHAAGESGSALDVETLLEAGLIDEETAARIAEFAAQRHESITSLYDGMGELSPKEREAAFEQGKRSDAVYGDVLDELVASGILTDVQAENIAAYFAGTI